MSDQPGEPTAARIEREREFWDHAVRPLSVHVNEFRLGPEANTRLMMEAIRPRPGLKVLDFACGVGLTSCWLASVGCDVTGIDLSPAAIGAARELAYAVGLDVRFLTADVESIELPTGGFGAVVGRYALHHLDVAAIAPVLAGCLASDGSGAFLETMGFNPVLSFARNHIAGHFGTTRYGDDDEHPLRGPDIAALRRAFGTVALTQRDYRFLLMFDRQALHGRHPLATRIARSVDQRLAHLPGLERWSFHQIVLVHKQAVGRDELIKQALAYPQVFASPDDPSEDHRRM